MAAHPTHGGLRGDLAEAVSEARELRPRRALAQVVRSFDENDLLPYASAIAFQTLFALIPVGLFGLALLGVLDLDGVWRDDLAPRVRDSVSGPVYALLDDTVSRVLRSGQLFWMTVGAALAVWKTSAAMRAVMGVLDRVYGTEDSRGTLHRFAISAVLAVAIGAALLAAVVVTAVGGAVVRAAVGDGAMLQAVSAVLRWGVALALLLGAMAVIVRYAPSDQHPWHWVSFGALVVVVGWVGMSLGFYVYLTQVASYGSVFGNLATIFVVVEYGYLASLVFVTGLQLDALAREQVAGD